LTTEYGKNKDISKNDRTDGRAAKILKTNDNLIEISMVEDNHDGVRHSFIMESNHPLYLPNMLIIKRYMNMTL
jgi:hypothetical protein